MRLGMHVHGPINGTCVVQIVSLTLNVQLHPRSTANLGWGELEQHPLTRETRTKLFEQHPVADPAIGEVAVAVAEVRHGVCDTTA